MTTTKVRLADSEGRGREYVANQDLQKGDVMFTARPVAAALRFEHLRSHCSGCFAPVDLPDDDDASTACGSCNLVSMCRVCNGSESSIPSKQDALYRHVRTGECKLLRTGEHSDTTGTRQPDDDAVNEVGAPMGMVGLETLEQHEETKSEESFRAYSGYVREVFEVLKAGGSDGGGEEGQSNKAATDESTETEKKSSDQQEEGSHGGEATEAEVVRAVGWLQALQHNQHAITCDLTGDMLGCMLSPEGSIFNHSCNPNCLWVMGPGGRIRFVVTEATRKDQPLCITYMHEHTPRLVRQEALREKWVFECGCARCADGQQDAGLVQRGRELDGDGAEVPSEKSGMLQEGLNGDAGSLSWQAKDLSDELEQWVTRKMQGEEGEEGVTLSDASSKIEALMAVAEGAALGDSHWSKLRLRVMAADLLQALGDAKAASEHYRMVVDNSPDIATHHTSQRYFAKLGLSLRSAAAALLDDEPEEEGGGGGGERSSSAERDAEALALEIDATKWLSAARDEMKVLYGEEHWAYQRVSGELQRALAVTIAARCRKKPRI